MATSVGSHFSPFDAAKASCSLERVAQLACHALDVPVAWTVVDGAVTVANDETASADAPAFSPSVLRALFEAVSPVDTPPFAEHATCGEVTFPDETTLQSVAVAPISGSSGPPVGALCVADGQRRSFSAQEMKDLETLAALAGAHPGASDDVQPEQHLRRGVKQIDHGLVVTDPEGRITWVNDGFVQLCGYTPDELRGKKPSTMLQGPKTDEDVTAAVRHHVQAGEGFSAELVNYRKSGEPYWVHIQAEPIYNPSDTIVGFIALETDVSERKALEEALRLERDLLTTTIDTVEALVVIVDPEARILRFNEACRRVTGYESQEVVGERVTDVLIPEDERPKVEAALEAHRTGQQQSTFECYWLTKSGERRLIEWSNTVLTDKHGDVQYLLGTGIDITEQRQLEQQILQVSEEERRRIGQDLHDLLASQLAGTAMMAKSLSQQLSRGREVSADDLGVIVEQVQNASKQARALSHSLMPARVEGSSLKEALRKLARNKQELTGLPHNVEVDADLPQIDETTAMHLYRIAYEAINNAAKHAEPSRVDVRLLRKKKHLVLEVRDDGVGIPEEVDPVDGLGLYMMQHRADVIKAALHVGPAEEGGTVVRCEVPMDVEAATT